MLTKEQSDIVDAVKEMDGGIISVNAVAGSGKTRVCNAIAEAVRPRNGFYTAFNKAIVDDSRSRFGHLIECRTIHALAYRHVKPSNRIQELSYGDITDDVEFEIKRNVLYLMNKFFLSKHTDIDDFFDAQEEEIPPMEKHLIKKYIWKLDSGKIPMTFNYMLKVLHYDLANGKASIEKDLLIGDEQQDSTEVAWEIFNYIKSPKKIILGDKFQNVYSFMDTINVFNRVKDDRKMHLTKSFRCNPEIADIVDDFGKNYLDKDFKFFGNPDVVERNISEVHLHRTNAELILEMSMLIGKKKFSIIRSTDEIFSLPIAILTSGYGKKVFNSKYKFLEKCYLDCMMENKSTNMYVYFGYLEEKFQKDINILSAIKILNALHKKKINIFDLKHAVEKMDTDKNVVLATAHSFKGLEADSVFIGNDLNYSLNLALEGECENPEEELNLYYVALSRARTALYGAM